MTAKKQSAPDAVEAKTEERAPAVVAGDAAAEAPKPEKKELKELVVPTVEGYVFKSRKPTFGDRRWIFAQPPGMNLPANEVLSAACLVELVKKTKNEAGEEIEEQVKLDPEVHPWFWFEAAPMEAVMIYMALWNQTFMPTEQVLASNMLYAMNEISKGN